MNKTYKIFLASTNKLQEERKAIEIMLNRMNNDFFKKNTRLELVLWENIDPEVTVGRKQAHYNRELMDCSILILLYWGELGKFTHEEYETAYNLLKEKTIKKIYIFEKTSEVNFELNPENVENLNKLKDILAKEDRQFWPVPFEHVDTLTKELEHWLNQVFHDEDNPDFNFGSLVPATLLSTNGAADPNVFLGREEELNEVRRRLDGHGKLLLINAEGGMGKTTLVAKYWNESLHNYKHNAWLFCGIGIVNALKELAPKLNVDLSGMDEAQQITALQKALSAVHDDFLLVLDNANDEDDIRVFRQTFEGFHWHVLITSRCQGVLDKAQEMPITHLPPPLAKALFERYYREDSPDFEALLDDLLQKLNYHTLCVELFAKTLKELAERGETMKQFVNNLETGGIFLGKRAKNINMDYTHRIGIAGSNSDDILANFYNFTHLAKDENLRYYLVNMALLPAIEYDFVFLCELFGQDAIEFEALHSLATKGWLGKNGQKFRINPIIQEIAIHKHQDTLATDAEVLLDKLNHIFENDGHDLLNTRLTVAAAFAKLIYQINKSLEAQPSWEIGAVNFGVGIYFNNIGDMVGTRYAHTNNQQIYRKLLVNVPENLSYKNGLAISYSKLGGIYEQTGDWKNALVNYQEDFRITKEIYESSPENLSYKNGLAISYEKLGGIYEQTGDWKNALLNYQERNRIGKEIYESSPENLSYKNGLAISYSRLGDIYNQIDDWKNALLNYQEYYRISKDIYENSPENLSYKSGLAISYQNLGVIYGQTGDWQNALLNYQEYNRLEKEITESSPENLSYKNGLAISYLKLGNIYKQTGDWKNALLNYQESNRIIEAIYESSPENLGYKNGLAVSYLKIAGVFMANEQSTDAVKNYDLCRKLFLEIVIATEGQLIDFVYNFTWTCEKLTDIVKQYALFDIIEKELLKSIRREGYKYIKPMYDAGLLDSNKVGLAEELGDEGWYDF